MIRNLVIGGDGKRGINNIPNINFYILKILFIHIINNNDMNLNFLVDLFNPYLTLYL